MKYLISAFLHVLLLVCVLYMYLSGNIDKAIFLIFWAIIFVSAIIMYKKINKK
jgi:hypothetical protein